MWQEIWQEIRSKEAIDKHGCKGYTLRCKIAYGLSAACSGRVKENGVKVSGDPVTVNEECIHNKSLCVSMRRRGGMKTRKPGNLLNPECWRFL